MAPLDRVKILFQTHNADFQKYQGQFLSSVVRSLSSFADVDFFPPPPSRLVQRPLPLDPRYLLVKWSSRITTGSSRYSATSLPLRWDQVYAVRSGSPCQFAHFLLPPLFSPSQLTDPGLRSSFQYLMPTKNSETSALLFTAGATSGSFLQIRASFPCSTT